MLSWKTRYCCIHQFREVDLFSKLPNEWECSTWMPISNRGAVSVVAEERRVTNMANGILSILSGFPHAMCIWPAVTELKGLLNNWEKNVFEKRSLTKMTCRKRTNPNHRWHLQTGSLERFKEKEHVINCFCFFLSGYPTMQSSFPWTWDQ